MIIHPAAQDWSALEAGQSALVVESPSLQYPATVDELTEDKTVLWITIESARRAFDHREGVVVGPA